MLNYGLPPKQGLYDPAHEHDECGIGFVADIKARQSHDIVQRGLEVLVNLTHRDPRFELPRDWASDP